MDARLPWAYGLGSPSGVGNTARITPLSLWHGSPCSASSPPFTSANSSHGSKKASDGFSAITAACRTSSTAKPYATSICSQNYSRRLRAVQASRSGALANSFTRFPIPWAFASCSSAVGSAIGRPFLEPMAAKTVGVSDGGGEEAPQGSWAAAGASSGYGAVATEDLGAGADGTARRSS